jgi:hypothetical protein
MNPVSAGAEFGGYWLGTDNVSACVLHATTSTRKPMPIRRRGQFWHYRFTIAGQECAGSTKLRATEANRKAAERIEKAERSRVIEGRAVEARKDFATAAGEFVSWCKDVQYRNKPNTAKRIAVSFASLVEFMGGLLVPSIEEAEVEQYKLHRVQVNGVKDVTLRHDLHSLSLLFSVCRANAMARGQSGSQSKSAER